MTLFNAETVELNGLNLIEASAGTGKTYTLAELYCRLVVEKELEVKQILVVTYTRAATEELRGRLRKKLVEQRQKLSEESQPDIKAIQRLKLAIQSFDEAAIFTIHGFCQRALQDFAFESGHFFDMEMVTDEEELKQAVVDDFWRRHISTAEPQFARYLQANKQSPEQLLKAVGSLPGKPYLNYLPLQDVELASLQAKFTTEFNRLREVWQTEGESVDKFLRDTKQLSQSSYKLIKVELWLQELVSLLSAEQPPIGLSENFIKFTYESVSKGLKKDGELPKLLFWSIAQTVYELDSAIQNGYEVALQRLRIQLAEYLRQELPKRKQQLKIQAFDDLLLNLQQSLHTEHGAKLAAQIRHQFQAALIDEFQDTDPVQYDCFKTIFSDAEHPVFFVGDPKQAIYSFRGADIFTYLKAKQASQREFNLDTNWRSHPSLVNAVNTLFKQVTNPFIYDDIPFHPVKAARPDEPAFTIHNQPVSPLEFVWLDSENDKPINVGEMQSLSANITALQIAELMHQSANGEATLTDKDGNHRALHGGDIAVLVRNHIQATAIQQALRQRGINSVQQSRENVFQSAQAVMLEHVLLAVAKPSSDSLIATALATPLFAKTALEIYTLQQDDLEWLQQSDFFQLLHETWSQSGFIVMFRFLLEQLDVQRRLLQQGDGERQLTNLMHLAELVQAYASRRNSSMEAVLTWLASQRKASSAAQDTAQIRLESDEQLVKVITIHTSKGLEYPIVFCPFLWHQRSNRNKPELRIFHRGDSHEACVAFGEPGLTEAEPIVELEAKAEDLRLLYVALTRARERCVILWGPARNSDQTALFSLLHHQLNKTDSAQMYADLVALTQQAPDVISMQQAVSQTVLPASAETKSVQLTARQFKGNIITPWQVGSFSGLSRGHSIEQPDYDADASTADWLQTPEQKHDRFGFPRGANAGTCLHSLFENWSFQPQQSDWPVLINKTLKQYGINEDWSDVVESWLTDVVQTTLDAGNGLKLGAIGADKRLDEMAFYFPVSHLTVKRLRTALQPFYEEMPVLEKVLAQMSFNDLTGFMKGFIDLVFEFEGRFYIADYKSNWLGDKSQDYDAESLNQAMIQHGYPLQYLIYSLALHRYLKIRMPDYDPEQHFGGVYYLFIRGMQPDWGQAGVYFDKPSPAMLNALDNCMQEVGHD